MIARVAGVPSLPRRMPVSCRAASPTEAREQASRRRRLQHAARHRLPAQGDLPLAKDKLDRALEQDPTIRRCTARAALLYDRLGRLARTPTSEYPHALRLAPHDPDISNNYAVFLCSRAHRRGRQTLPRRPRQPTVPHAPRPPTPTPACACARAKRDDAKRAAVRAGAADHARLRRGRCAARRPDIQPTATRATRAL